MFLHGYHATVLRRKGKVSFHRHAVSITPLFHHRAVSRTITTTLFRYRVIQLQRHRAVESIPSGERRGCFPHRFTLAARIEEAPPNSGTTKNNHCLRRFFGLIPAQCSIDVKTEKRLPKDRENVSERRGPFRAVARSSENTAHGNRAA